MQFCSDCSREAAECPGAVPASQGEVTGGSGPAKEDGAGGLPRHVSPAEKILQGSPDEGSGWGCSATSLTCARHLWWMDEKKFKSSSMSLSQMCVSRGLWKRAGQQEPAAKHPDEPEKMCRPPVPVWRWDAAAKIWILQNPPLPHILHLSTPPDEVMCDHALLSACHYHFY